MRSALLHVTLVVLLFSPEAVLRAGTRAEIRGTGRALDAAPFPLVVDRVSPCGRFYVVPNLVTDAVRVFNRDGNAHATWLSGQVRDARGTLSFDLSGNLLVSQFDLNRVLAVDSDGNVAYTVSAGGLYGPEGATVAPGGGLAVCSYLSDSIKFFSSSGGYLSNLSDHVSDPLCLVFDRDGNLYVGNRADGAGHVAKFNADRQFVQSFGNGLFFPHPLDIALNKDQILYVTTPGIVWKFDRQGMLLGPVAEGGLNPAGLAFDEIGNLWVTNAAAPNVYRFDAQDRFLGVTSLGSVPSAFKLAGIAFDAKSSSDCDNNAQPDLCDVTTGGASDCNRNGRPDVCDLPDNDCDGDGIPDDCEPDCDHDCLPDACELSCGDPGGLCDRPGCGLGKDCNHNSIPDACDLDGAEVSYESFASTTGLNLVGVAAPVDGRIRIVPIELHWSAGAFWLTDRQRIAGGFHSTFQFNLNPEYEYDADGFAFVIQNQGSSALGEGAHFLGYGGIPASLAIEFDVWDNGSFTGDLNDNHVAVHSSGTQPNYASEANRLAINTAVPDLWNATTYTVDVVYIPGRLQVYITPVVGPVIDIPANLSSLLGLADGKAWVGFTAGSGGASHNFDILNWKFATGSNDCQGNGVPDECEITEVDCNHNGVPDDCELATSGDCDKNQVPDDCQPDCDGDGTPDVCVLMNCPPNHPECQDCNANGVPDECDSNGGPVQPPFGSIRNPANGHYYLLTTVPTSWPVAESIAKALRGHLATVSDAAENAWIRTTFDPLTTDPAVFIGFNDIEHEGQFGWASGEPVTYTNWIPGEPNNNGNSEDWGELHLDGWAGKWNDYDGNRLGLVEVVLSNDCDQNGVIDECDIAAGRQRDCDGGGVPDECEPDADADGITDRCDGFADYDHDADVDLNDVRYFSTCLGVSGPDHPLTPGECRDRFDSNESATVDLRDTAAVQRSFTGPR